MGLNKEDAMDSNKHLIIGAGPAALAAAQAIRGADKSAVITLVTREETLPYSPAMLPYLINSELAEKDLFGKGRDILDTLNLKLVTGKEVVAVKPDQRTVEYADGESESYDKLLIATGAAPQVPQIADLPAEQVYTYRTFRDFERLRDTLKGQQDIAIFGAGLVAVEAAEKLCLAGHRVTIIARSSLLRKYFNPGNVAVIEKAFAQNGGRVITKNTLVSARQAADKLELVLQDGEKLSVDRLIVATGVTANLIGKDLIPVVEGGLKVDKRLETNLPNVYAAGDVAATPSFYDGHSAPCPILTEAVWQGRIAGANMAGETAEYKGWVGGNYLRCFDHHLFSIGLSGALDESYETVEKKEDNSFLKLVFKGEYLVGVEGLNQKLVHPGVFQYLIREQVPVGTHRQLLLAKPRETACWLMSQHRKNQAI
jgi:phenylglyoxylate dehydrogenase epsilon subunit